MIQEDKELLLKDLCARLPYGVICKINNRCVKVEEINPFEGVITYDGWLSCGIDEDIKPYLRPMSSMTEDEKREIYDWLVENDVDWFDFNKLRLDEILISFDSSWLLVNWLLKNHFDFMGLIEKGLALEALEGMYKED